MAKESKGIAMVILGIVAIVAVIGLVLMFMQSGVVGKYAIGSYERQGRYSSTSGNPCDPNHIASLPEGTYRDRLVKSCRFQAQYVSYPGR